MTMALFESFKMGYLN